MSCARAILVLMTLGLPAFAAAINTDSAVAAGRGIAASRTQLRYARLEQDIDRYLIKQTFWYGATNKTTVFGTFGYLSNTPGSDGFTDIEIKGRFEFFGRDARRETLSFSALVGVEIPVKSLGDSDGGVLGGLVGTWEKGGWRIDGAIKKTWRSNARDSLQSDLALSKIIHERDVDFWFVVLELNHRQLGGDDVLFLAPGIVYEHAGYKIEFSAQVRVWEDAAMPTANVIFVVGFVFVF